MYSVNASDVTARARIRDAAIALIAEHGLRGTTIKAVAQAADVSPALVIHHFGSKDGLRHACDEHVIERLITGRFGVAEAPTAEGVSQIIARAAQYGQDGAYLARLLVEGGAAGNDVFDRLLAITEAQFAAGRESGTIRPTEDPRGLAAAMVVSGLGMLVLRHHLERALGTDPFSAEGNVRLTLPLLDLYTHGLYTDDALLRATEAAFAAPQPATERKP